ncbi:hypothetical protein SGLAU_32780 (plasmid) [Streptomyces glaucescens]|uniref:Uncharacterized protein n=1 Tax=Streptomyces glaucescens TaxID=1907 RepID=A0A089XET8_STRGA|nr:hypothetical protein SGLAU_32780 [Streptomyces glaucescens]
MTVPRYVRTPRGTVHVGRPALPRRRDADPIDVLLERERRGTRGRASSLLL